MKTGLRTVLILICAFAAAVFTPSARAEVKAAGIIAARRAEPAAAAGTGDAAYRVLSDDADGESYETADYYAAGAAEYGATSAQSMALMEAKSGRLLNDFNADKKLPMASTTKVVTAIVVIENCKLDATVKVPAEAAGVEGSSIYLEKDEVMTVEALLYGLMLQSGNDCAVALAVHAGGSVPKFADMMNAFAAKIGAVNSHFTNPHGLHHKEHYTTARDLCRISCYAMQNPAFKKITGTKEYRTSWVNRDYGRRIMNKNKILSRYTGGNGVKTGFTRAAGRCLVSAAERDGMQLVCTVLNCGPMFEECMRLMDAGFKEYRMTEILEAQRHLGELPVVNGRKPRVRVYTYRPLHYPLKTGEEKDIKLRIELPEKIVAPVAKHQTAGKIKIYLRDKLLASEDVCAMEDVRAVTLADRLGDLLREWF